MYKHRKLPLIEISVVKFLLTGSREIFFNRLAISVCISIKLQSV